MWLQQRNACANNLRKFWVGVEVYSDHNNGEFPRVEAQGPRGVAGIFVPILRDAGLIQDVSVGCAASGERPPANFSVRDVEEMSANSPQQFRRVASDLAGSYAYCLGYREGSTHRGLRRDSGDSLPIMADRSQRSGEGNSPNHGGKGQNVLYTGGWVRWCVQPNVGINGDDIYLNLNYRVQAGLKRADTVLGASDARAYPADEE
jgi:hypothetical protein